MYKQTNHAIINIAENYLFSNVPFGFYVAATLFFSMIHDIRSSFCDRFMWEEILKGLYDLSRRSKISRSFSSFHLPRDLAFLFNYQW